jgi:uncharacterized protein with HEPN domain
MLETIQGIESALAGRTQADYSSDWVLKHAVERGIEIISEASRRLPVSLRDQRPEVNWKQIMGIGNILRHDYDEIVDEIIYEAARKKLAALKVAIIAIEAGLDEPTE